MKTRDSTNFKAEVIDLKRALICLIALVLVLSGGCHKKAATKSFTATVISVYETSIMVEPDKKSQLGMEVSVLFASAEAASIQAGDNVEVTYSGEVMTSYPPQIRALSCKVLQKATSETEVLADFTTMPQTTSTTAPSTSKAIPITTNRPKPLQFKGKVLYSEKHISERAESIITSLAQLTEANGKYQIDPSQLSYSESFFQENMLLMAAFAEPSSSYSHKINGVALSDTLADIHIERIEAVPGPDKARRCIAVIEVKKNAITDIRLIVKPQK